MKTTYGVMERKTGVILVEGSKEYCEKWVKENCHHNEKYDIWKDADHEEVIIVVQ